MNQAWKLESFLDAIVMELDKARETLAIKAVNKPLNYAVKDLAIELQTFPTYDGDDVRFVTAQPGQTGASKISVQLGSITDQQVRATSKEPPSKSDVQIADAKIEPSMKNELRKLGVTSVSDLERIDRENIDLAKVPERNLDPGAIANLIRQRSRDRTPPVIKRATLSRAADGRRRLTLSGQALALSAEHQPEAVVDGRQQRVVRAAPDAIEVELDAAAEAHGARDVVLALDPYCVLRVELKSSQVGAR